MLPRFFAFLGLVSVGAEAAHWAVIVAGSNSYSNYRHQADACHAYQIVKAKGIPEENIILMMYDDVAHSSENPFPGKLFNKPDPHGPGKDVYAGCKVDYKGKEVTPQNFINVLLGKGMGKVLKSTGQDHVFVNFIDHGAPGLIAFPSAEMHKTQLQQTLKQMHTANMFQRLVFYLETCESGSMFVGMNIPGVYAVSAANAKESSWGTYCPNGKNPPEVNGQNLQTCLGDLFSVSWLEDSDSEDTTKETLKSQFTKVKTLTTKSHVTQWGDESFTSDTVSEYFGSQQGTNLTLVSAPEDLDSAVVPVHKINLHILFRAYQDAETSKERLSWGEKLKAELIQQEMVESIYRRFAELAYPGDEAAQKDVRRRKDLPNFMECELAAHEAIRIHCANLFDANSGFALSFHQVVVNVCADVARGLSLAVAAVAEQACQISSPSKAIVV